MPLTLPDGSPSDVVLNVVGKESDRFHAASMKWLQHMQVRDGTLPLQEMADIQADLVATLIVGWTGLTENGSPVPYSHAKAVELVRNPGLAFLREQVEAFADKRTNFFRHSPPAVDSVGEATGAAEHSEEGRTLTPNDA